MELPKLNQAQATYLNFVRATAAMLVLFGHAASFFIRDSQFEKVGLQNGAVFVFFLLSGFLISYSVLNKHHDETYRFRDYFADRFFRIYTAFIPALIFAAIVDSFSMRLFLRYSTAQVAAMSEWLQKFPESYSLSSWLGNLFMLQGSPTIKVVEMFKLSDGLLVRPFGSAGPFWTISVEWWIYMSFGMIAFTWFKGRSMTWPQIVVFALVSLTPVYFFVGGPDQCLTLLWITGALASVLYIRLPAWIKSLKAPVSERRVRIIALVAFAFFCFCAVARLAMIYQYDRKYGLQLEEKIRFREFQFGLFMAGALFSALFFFKTVKKIPRLIERIISFFADYSYSLYLIHAPILVFLALYFPGHENDYAFYWMACALVNVVAIAFWWLFERHYHRLSRWVRRAIASDPVLKIPAVTR